MIPLGQLFTTSQFPDSRVCFQPGRTWGELRHTVNQIQRRLPVAASQPWLLAVDSTFQFTAALLAGWQAGISLIISPDTQPGTLAQLRPLIGGCLADRPVELSGLPIIQLGNEVLPQSAENGEPVPIELPAEALALELFTSGSTGERKRVPKTFAQLDRELAALHQLWDDTCQGHVPCATVSHLHIYGLLFKVLWPLCRGDTVPECSFFFWEELLGQLPAGPATVVSSPAHLRYLPQAAQQFPRDWSQTRIFSSGGPLPLETALAVMTICGQAPVEVYGSTETGGIAARQQAGDREAAWRSLPGVSTKVEAGLLAVCSPWLPDAGQWLLTGDRAESAGGNEFHLLGRSDRIAKIAEKRISLTEMETILGEHPLVQEARTLLLPTRSKFGRELLAAAIELNPAGLARLSELGKTALTAELKRHLQPHFEAVAVPRSWRLVPALPRDAQGKVTFAPLAELFAAHPPPTGPIVLKREPTASGSLLHLQVPTNLAYLDGHFPRFAVVPGVVQLKWVTEEIAAFTGRPAVVTAMSAVKFHELLRPGQSFCLEFSFNAQTSKWNYRLFHGERTISSGRLQFSP